MRRYNTVFIISLLLFCIFNILTATGFSYPVGVANITDLVEKSEVVCKGQVLEVHSNANSGKIATLRIDRVFKGQINTSTINIEFPADCCDIPTTTLRKNDYFLVFLKQSKSANYIFADQTNGKMPITSSIISASQGLDTFDLIELELNASLRDSERNIALTAIVQLGNLKKVNNLKPLKEITLGSDMEMIGKAYGSLILLGDYSVFDAAVSFAEQPTNDVKISRAQASIATAIGKIQNHAMINKLNKLLSANNTYLRQNVAHSLRALKNPLSAPYMIQALNDPDLEVRYNALLGLAMIEKKYNEWSPGIDNFKQNQTYYINRWQQWWKIEGELKYQHLK